MFSKLFSYLFKAMFAIALLVLAAGVYNNSIDNKVVYAADPQPVVNNYYSCCGTCAVPTATATAVSLQPTMPVCNPASTPLPTSTLPNSPVVPASVDPKHLPTATVQASPTVPVSIDPTGIVPTTVAPTTVVPTTVPVVPTTIAPTATDAPVVDCGANPGNPKCVGNSHAKKFTATPGMGIVGNSDTDAPAATATPKPKKKN